MHHYFREETMVLDKVVFDYLGGRYRGHGFLHWKPDRGFHIEATVERSGPPLPYPLAFRSVEVPGPEDVRALRLRPRNQRWAIAPDIYLGRNLELVSDGHLSIDCAALITSHDAHPDEDDQHFWRGEALYRSGDLLLPGKLKTETTLDGHPLRGGFSLAGLRETLPDDGYLLGEVVDRRYAEFRWRLPRSKWTRAEAWRWPEAVRCALSFASGHELLMLQRGLQRGACWYEETIRERPITLMEVYAPLGEWKPVRQDLFVRLAMFLIRETKEAEICRRILAQTAEAVRQRTSQGRELLLATILEAALRTLKSRPFHAGGPNFSVRGALEDYRAAYLAEEWRPICDRAFRTWQALRHRNAHPDWLTNPNRLENIEQRSEALDDAIFLCRFYGYMVLALAGFSIQPTFPAPHRDWRPNLTINPRNP